MTVTKHYQCPLLYASCEENVDILYFGQFFVPDPYLAFAVGEDKMAVMSALEYRRAQRESAYSIILSLEICLKKAKEYFGRASLVNVIRLMAMEYGIGSFLIPENFPVGLAWKLKKVGVRLSIKEGSFFPERRIKKPEEVEAIRDANRAAAAGLSAAKKALKASIERGSQLYLNGHLLTSERLRAIVEVACLERGAVAGRTIVAGGEQACDPHCIGYGPLRKGELIVVDVFPRGERGYFGDMSRTFIRGRASEAQKQLVHTVLRAQELAIAEMGKQRRGKQVHRVVERFFEKEGYKGGFFHGTGHGVGLQVHEPPFVSSRGLEVLLPGMVVTAEPGLYYPGLGGCRIEDVIHVTKKGAEKISEYPYTPFEIIPD